MKNLITIPLMLVRTGWVIALCLGIAISFAGVNIPIGVHMLVGLIVALALIAVAILGKAANPARSILLIAFAIAQPACGLAQNQDGITPGKRTLFTVLHIGLALATIALAEITAKAARK